MEIQTLRKTIGDIGAKSKNVDWKQRLNARKKAELDFHNLNRDKELTESLPSDTYELLHGNKKFYETVEASQAYVDTWLRKNVPGKVFLDYACGNGDSAIKCAKAGATLAIGLDISDVSIRNATASAQSQGVGDRCEFVQGDCEATGLPDDCVDVILCSGMLHHLDLSYAFPEMRRILRPGGRILCVEALDYNPAIKAYRWLTPSMRTDWEKRHILSLKDVRFAKRFFDLGEIRFFHIFSIAAAYLNRTPWLMSPLLKVFNGLDSLLTRVPGLQLMAWQFTFELRKPRE